ncbi:MAG: HU family DNA-binding protein [Pirellulaceae bacterium]
MTKKDIVKAISEKIDMTQLQTNEIVQHTFDAIMESLAQKGRVELRNFGVFIAKKRAARTARNPKTEETVHVPEKIVVTFKPGKKMEQLVSDMEPSVLDDGPTSEQVRTPLSESIDYASDTVPEESPLDDSAGDLYV